MDDDTKPDHPRLDGVESERVPSLEKMAEDSFHDRQHVKQGSIAAAWIGIMQVKRFRWAMGPPHNLVDGRLENYCKDKLGLSRTDQKDMPRLFARLDDAEAMIEAWATAERPRGKCPTWRFCLNKLLGPGPKVARALAEAEEEEEEGLTDGDLDGSELVEGIKNDILAEENGALADHNSQLKTRVQKMEAEVQRLAADNDRLRQCHAELTALVASEIQRTDHAEKLLRDYARAAVKAETADETAADQTSGDQDRPSGTIDEVEPADLERGSKLLLTYYLSVARRLVRGVEEDGYDFEWLADRHTNLGPDAAVRLYYCDRFATQIWERCETERGEKLANGRSYEYPDWRTALNWFDPDQNSAEKRISALEADNARLREQLADLEDTIARPEPDREKSPKRWLEQHVLAMTHGLFDTLLITVGTDKTLVQAADAHKSTFLRANIPQTFPGLVTTGWDQIKRSGFARIDAKDRRAIDQALVAEIPWDVTLPADAMKTLLANVPTGDKTIATSVLDGTDRAGHGFAVKTIKAILRRKPSEFRFSRRGILGCEIIRDGIKYEYFLRDPYW